MLCGKNQRFVYATKRKSCLVSFAHAGCGHRKHVYFWAAMLSPNQFGAYKLISRQEACSKLGSRLSVQFLVLRQVTNTLSFLFSLLVAVSFLFTVSGASSISVTLAVISLFYESW